MKKSIKLAKHGHLNLNDEGYTIFDTSMGIPIIMTDIPFSRLKESPVYVKEFIDLLEVSKERQPEETAHLDAVINDIRLLVEKEKTEQVDAMQSPVEMIENDEKTIQAFHNRGYGPREYYITEEDIKALKENKIIAIDDGEYTTTIALRESPKKLKAYSVTENVSYEHAVLVFAENANQARNIAKGTGELDPYDYIQLRARRAKYADGHEHDDEHELLRLKIRNGWWYEIDGHHITSDNLDEMIAKGII